jgi:hypothetical protein
MGWKPSPETVIALCHVKRSGWSVFAATIPPDTARTGGGEELVVALDDGAAVDPGASAPDPERPPPELHPASITARRRVREVPLIPSAMTAP